MKHILPITAGFALALLAASPLSAHEGHAEAPGTAETGTATGPITITAEAAKNLGLKTETAELRSLQKTLSLLGSVEPDPARVGVVASRIAGRITRLTVKEGDVVTTNDVLVEVESRQIGDPPPRVTLKAPLTGTVIERPVFTGDSIEPDARLIVIADLSEVYLIGRLYEGQVAQVNRGQSVRIRPEAYPDVVLTGSVEGFTARIDPASRTLGVRVRVPNPGTKLLPNMLATMHIVVAEADTAITVPVATVLGEAGNHFVFVQDGADPQTFRRTPVVLGLHDDRMIEVIEGVLPGDNVVTTGNYQLQYVTSAPKPPAAPAAESKAGPAATPTAK